MTEIETLRAHLADQRRAGRIRAGQERVDVPVTLLRSLLVEVHEPAACSAAAEHLGQATYRALVGRAA